MKAAALVMTVVLLTVIALCPSAACPMRSDLQPDSDSCCHKSHSHPVPCPAKTAPDCPYTIIEKSNINSGASHWSWAGIVSWHKPGVPAVAVSTICHRDGRLVNSADIFLRNRVLLI